jgi:hypothetical protein
MTDTLQQYTVSVEVRFGTLVNSVESKSEGWKEKQSGIQFWTVVEPNPSCETYVSR